MKLRGANGARLTLPCRVTGYGGSLGTPGGGCGPSVAGQRLAPVARGQTQLLGRRRRRQEGTGRRRRPWHWAAAGCVMSAGRPCAAPGAGSSDRTAYAPGRLESGPAPLPPCAAVRGACRLRFLPAAAEFLNHAL